MSKLQQAFDGVFPTDWGWCLYSATERCPARALVWSPDRIQFGEADGHDIESAISAALNLAFTTEDN